MTNTAATRRVVLVAITIDDQHATDTDLTDALAVALANYSDADGFPAAPTTVRAAVVPAEVAAHIGGALWVGLGNEDEVGDAALTAAHALNLDGNGNPDALDVLAGCAECGTPRPDLTGHTLGCNA